MAHPVRVIVVDDEPDLREMIAAYLGKHGFVVAGAGDARELDALLNNGAPDLVILDVNLPGEDGFAIARRLRAHSDVPIIMLTGAGDTVDRVVGLELGADDYVTKPFDPRELRARIHSVLRRVRRPPDSRSGSPAKGVRFGELVLDLESRRLLQPDGMETPLTAMEFDLLAAFARNPNRVLSRESSSTSRTTATPSHSIAASTFGSPEIRRKVERDPGKPQIIKTMRGAGYMFVPGAS